MKKTALSFLTVYIFSILFLFLFDPHSLYVKLIAGVSLFLYGFVRKPSLIAVASLLTAPLVFLFLAMGTSIESAYFLLLVIVAFLAAYISIQTGDAAVVVPWLFYITSALIFLLVVVQGTGGRTFAGSFKPGYSVNYTTFLLFLTCCVYFLTKISVSSSLPHLIQRVKKYRWIFIFPILLSFYLDSRSSLLVASYYLVMLSLWCALVSRLKASMMALIWWILYLVPVLMILYFLYHDARFVIFNDWYKCVDWSSHLLGLALEEETCGVLTEKFLNNPHNSMLRRFNYFGVFGFLSLAVYIYVVVKTFSSKSSMLYMSAVFAVFLRALTDSVTVPFYTDYVTFLILLLALRGTVAGPRKASRYSEQA